MRHQETKDRLKTGPNVLPNHLDLLMLFLRHLEEETIFNLVRPKQSHEETKCRISPLASF